MEPIVDPVVTVLTDQPVANYLTLALVLITGWYAWHTRQTVKAMREQNERLIRPYVTVRLTRDRSYQDRDVRVRVIRTSDTEFSTVYERPESGHNLLAVRFDAASCYYSSVRSPGASGPPPNCHREACTVPVV